MQKYIDAIVFLVFGTTMLVADLTTTHNLAADICASLFILAGIFCLIRDLRS